MTTPAQPGSAPHADNPAATKHHPEPTAERPEDLLSTISNDGTEPDGDEDDSDWELGDLDVAAEETVGTGEGTAKPRARRRRRQPRAFPPREPRARASKASPSCAARSTPTRSCRRRAQARSAVSKRGSNVPRRRRRAALALRGAVVRGAMPFAAVHASGRDTVRTFRVSSRCPLCGVKRTTFALSEPFRF